MSQPIIFNDQNELDYYVRVNTLPCDCGQIGEPQLLFFAFVLLVLIGIGYYIGNKNGQLKARKELEKKQ